MSRHQILVFSSWLGIWLSTVSFAADWPQFRGPGGSGVSDETVPLVWNSAENVIWKIPLPGYGASSPIVVGNKIIVTCYSGFGLDTENPGDETNMRLHVVCYDRKNGDLLWDKRLEPQLPERPYEQFLPEHGYASGTCASDGESVFAFFGRSGVWALDLDGNNLWNVDVGSNTHIFGSGTSPILVGDLVIVNASVECGDLIALNKRTGQELWRAADIKDAWNTPALVKSQEGQQELVVNTSGKILGLDPRTGASLWSCDSADTYICPSVVSHENIVYAIGGRGPEVVAVKAGGRGDVTETHRLWVAQESSNVPSPVYHEGHLYWVNDDGIAHCVDVETGETLYKNRVNGAGKTYASVVLAGGRLYVVTWHNGTFVLDASPEFNILAHNVFDEDDSIFNASPAISHGQMFLRSNKFLYCISETAN